jgi:hypothetical protein
VVLKTQLPSGSGFKLQPGGSHADVQVDGSGGCDTMLTQVCVCAPLQVCATGLHVVCVAPLHACGWMLLQAAGEPPTQASFDAPLQAAGVPPVHDAMTLQVPVPGAVHTPTCPLHTPV